MSDQKPLGGGAWGCVVEGQAKAVIEVIHIYVLFTAFLICS